MSHRGSLPLYAEGGAAAVVNRALVGQELGVLIQAPAPQALRADVVKTALPSVMAAMGVRLTHGRATGHTCIVELLQGHPIVVLVGQCVRGVVRLRGRVVLLQNARVSVPWTT